MTTRDIRAHLREMYDVEVSPDLISRVTDGLLEALQEWQSRPLDAVYPVIFIDALMVKLSLAGVAGALYRWGPLRAFPARWAASMRGIHPPGSRNWSCRALRLLPTGMTRR